MSRINDKLSEQEGRDGQKTHDGIETGYAVVPGRPADRVETVRKPTTGLKQRVDIGEWVGVNRRDGQKTHDGIETGRRRRRLGARVLSRRSENPRRD